MTPCAANFLAATQAARHFPPTMKFTRVLLLVALLAAFTSISLAQTQAKLGPDDIVANLYKAHKAGSGPFNQTKDRKLVERYFMKDLANLIWKDAVSSAGEVGAIGFDPLFASQDPQITEFKINKSGWAADAKFKAEDKATVEVTFKDGGKRQTVRFAFDQDEAEAWKIDNIVYPDAASLREIFAANAG